MYELTSKLIIYKNIGEDSILFHLSKIFYCFEKGNYEKDDLIKDIYVEIHKLLDLATKYGFDNIFRIETLVFFVISLK